MIRGGGPPTVQPERHQLPAGDGRATLAYGGLLPRPIGAELLVVGNFNR